jgi:hypothetical protein
MLGRQARAASRESFVRRSLVKIKRERRGGETFAIANEMTMNASAR